MAYFWNGYTWQWGEPNRYGHVGLNCKNRASGSGTTHANRKAMRAAMQWDALAQNEDPGSKECLEKRKKALESALEKANKKLESLEKDSDEKDQETEEASSSSNVNYRGSRSKKSKGSLEKGPVPDGTLLEMRRGRVAKDGSKEKLLQVKEEEESLGKGTKHKAPALEKAEKKNKTNAEKKPLEKGTKGDKKKEKPLEKGTEGEKKPLGKGPKATLTPNKEALEKANAKKYTIVVDWHNTLEVNNSMPPQNAAALEKLLEVANVHILSYVETKWRECKVHRQVKQLLPDLWERVSSINCCFERIGKDGKASWCKWLGATVIMDDCNEIILECQGEGLMCFAIVSRHERHGNLPVGVIYDDFAQAVDCFLEL